MMVSDVDTASQKVAVVLNTYNYLDSDGEVLCDGAATKSILERGVGSSSVAKIKFAKDHDLTQLPGKFIELGENNLTYGGVAMKCISGVVKMADTTLGRDTLKNYLEGVYDNHSIGFQYLQRDFINADAHGNSAEAKAWNQMRDSLINPDALKTLRPVMDWMSENEGKTGVYMVKEIKLYEGSVVAFGANSMTPYLGTKSGNKDVYLLSLVDRLSKLESTFKTGTQSDECIETIGVQILQLKQLMRELCANLKEPKVIDSGKSAAEIESELIQKAERESAESQERILKALAE